MPTALVVEDDPRVLDAVEERLESMGHKCVRASSQAEAREHLEHQRFDYILLDLEIPGRFESRPDLTYGQNLLRQIREMPAQVRTPVIIMTGHGLKSHHLAVEMMKLGANDFVGKPFGPENPLETKIRDALESRKSRTADAEIATATPFKGGDMVFYEDRIELLGVAVCGAVGSSNKRRVLDLLRQKTPRGDYRTMSCKAVADKLRLSDRPGAVLEAVSAIRKDCSQKLLAALGVLCDGNDVIERTATGYRLRDRITVMDGIDETEELAARRRITLSDNQRAIIRALRKRGNRTQKQLSDALGILTSALKLELKELVETGLVAVNGSGTDARFRLAEAV